MELDLYVHLLYWGFGIAVIFGIISHASNFCTMGAVSDWVNMGDLNRMRTWMLAIAIGLAGLLGMEWLGLVDASLLTSNDTATPPYHVAQLNWPRHLLGGLLFGIGMTLGSGCGSKTMIRLGGGNIKSIVVLLAIASSAWLMIFTSVDYELFLSWMEPMVIDLSQHGIEAQEPGAVLAGLLGLEDVAAVRLAFGGVTVLALFTWVFTCRDFREERMLMFAGVAIGLMVVLLWFFTAGPDGQTLLEELDFLDERPYATGAQSLTFIAPTAHGLQYLLTGMAPIYLTLALVILLGTFFGSLLYALLFRQFRFEWFNSWGDFFSHLIGGVLMGVGGVLGMGCTVGQGISGASTLSIGSWLTLCAIVFGGVLTMKYRYYRMLYEDASLMDVGLSILVDLRLLPQSLRRLESL